MMEGNVDWPRHWAAHLMLLRDVQCESGGFTKFVPLPLVHTRSPIYLAGVARPGPTVRDTRGVNAVARLVLHGTVDHIQSSWVTPGEDQCVRVLGGGVDDLGGTLMEEPISRTAGSSPGSRRSGQQLEKLIVRAGNHSGPSASRHGFG